MEASGWLGDRRTRVDLTGAGSLRAIVQAAAMLFASGVDPRSARSVTAHPRNPAGQAGASRPSYDYRALIRDADVAVVEGFLAAGRERCRRGTAQLDRAGNHRERRGEILSTPGTQASLRDSARSGLRLISIVKELGGVWRRTNVAPSPASRLRLVSSAAGNRPAVYPISSVQVSGNAARMFLYLGTPSCLLASATPVEGGAASTVISS